MDVCNTIWSANALILTHILMPNMLLTSSEVKRKRNRTTSYNSVNAKSVFSSNLMLVKYSSIYICVTSFHGVMNRLSVHKVVRKVVP